MSRITLTLAVPASLIPAANELACIGGLSEADRQTFREPRYQAAGVHYAVSSFTVAPEWLDAMTGPLWEPEWGADLTLAQAAQNVLDMTLVQQVGDALVPLHPTPSATSIAVYQGEDVARWIGEHLTPLPSEGEP